MALRILLVVAAIIVVLMPHAVRAWREWPRLTAEQKEKRRLIREELAKLRLRGTVDRPSGRHDRHNRNP